MIIIYELTHERSLTHKPAAYIIYTIYINIQSRVVQKKNFLSPTIRRPRLKADPRAQQHPRKTRDRKSVAPPQLRATPCPATTVYKAGLSTV